MDDYVLRLIQDHDGEVTAAWLIDAMAKRGSEDQAARVLRSMLDRGDIVFGPEMRIQQGKENSNG